jgi:hypothetical protein
MAREILKDCEPVKAPLVQAHWRTRILLRCERQRGTASALPAAAGPPVSQGAGLNATGSRTGPHAFVEEHRWVYGVEPMCKMLQIAQSTYYERRAIYNRF